MASAMAEAGQIKLHGEQPTVAEATLARARKRVLKSERLAMEEQLKRELGPLAYYKQWVKAWRRDTSKAAVARVAAEMGKSETDQLLDMLSCQTQKEYRQMQGTDVRIKRDPLVMRMKPEQIMQACVHCVWIKVAVWGGDPVYPTVNYEQDPNLRVDYTGPTFHRYTPTVVEVIRRTGRLITKEELLQQQAREKAEDLELTGFDETVADAIDIGDKDDDQDEDDVDEDAEE
eukprot:SM000177S03164  [mRNA]  locus=s177:508:2255:+ [translate_table: standard]